jgi:hypothetical protein
MSAPKLARNGKTGSTRSARRSSKRSSTQKLERLLTAIYPAFQKLDNAAADQRCRQDFVFHMTDWSEDLQNLAALYRRPERFNKAEAEAIVSRFLYHVIPHLTEAGRLLLDYEPGRVFASTKNTTKSR